MITTGSKFYFGLAGAGLLAAIVYGVITNGLDHGGVAHLMSSEGAVDALLGPLSLGYKGGVGEHVGYILLMGFAACTLSMGLVVSAFRDGDVEAVAELDADLTVADIAGLPTAPDGPSYWPVAAAVGVALMTLGLAVGSALFVVGAILVVISAVMWTVRAWADRATGDVAVNRAVRDRFIRPFEFPIAAVIAAAVLVVSVSRLFLSLSSNGAWIAALLFGALIFSTGIVASTRPQLRKGLVASILAIGLVLIVGVGIYGAVKGERFAEHPPAGESTGH